MEFNELVQVVNNVGFPIAVCYYLMKHNTKNDDKLIRVIENNTKALTELKNKVEG